MRSELTHHGAVAVVVVEDPIHVCQFGTDRGLIYGVGAAAPPSRYTPQLIDSGRGLQQRDCVITTLVLSQRFHRVLVLLENLHSYKHTVMTYSPPLQPHHNKTNVNLTL